MFRRPITIAPNKMGKKAKEKRGAMPPVTINWTKAIGGLGGFTVGVVLLVKAIIWWRGI